MLAKWLSLVTVAEILMARLKLVKKFKKYSRAVSKVVIINQN